jgi:hypothetical protein
MPFVYRCPDTGLHTEFHASSKTSDDAHDVEAWVLCGRIHLTTLATGKALCEEEPPVPDGALDQTELTA